MSIFGPDNRHILALAILCCGAYATGASAAESAPNTLTTAEKDAGWVLLFDGRDVDQWRNYKGQGVGNGWKIADGVLTRAEKNAGDLITKRQYGAFEFTVDYKISKAGNSGLMYHVTEEEEKPWQTGPEVQIQDNVDGHDAQKSGWLYQFYPADVDATKPAGEWNTLRILITPEKCVHWMNGVKYAEYVKGSADWRKKLAASKFSRWPRFGKADKGHICLQDHGNVVSFRNIKLREITP